MAHDECFALAEPSTVRRRFAADGLAEERNGTNAPWP